MIISKLNENGKITLILDGWLDTEAAPVLAAEIDTINDAESIVLDFDKVEYMASSGLRQVVSIYNKAKEMGASFAIINAHEKIMSIFELTALNKKINISAAD